MMTGKLQVEDMVQVRKGYVSVRKEESFTQ